MTTLPTDIELPAEFGTVVNNTTDTPDEYEQLADELIAPIECRINLTASEHARLQRLLADQRLTVGDFCAKLIKEEIGQRVGKAFITAPSFAASTVKVTSPQGSVTRG